MARPYTHAGTAARASRAEDFVTVLFQGLGFMICAYFILPRHSARQRHHDAFGAALPPSLIQCWNDTNNGKVFADSIFEITYVRTLLNPGWSGGQLLNY